MLKIELILKNTSVNSCKVLITTYTINSSWDNNVQDSFLKDAFGREFQKIKLSKKLY